MGPPNLLCPCPISLTHPCQWATTHMDISSLPQHKGTPSSSTTSPHSRATRLLVTLSSPPRAILHSSHLRAILLRDRLTLAILLSLVLQVSHSGGRQRREKAFTIDPKLSRINSLYINEDYICSTLIPENSGYLYESVPSYNMQVCWKPFCKHSMILAAN